MSNVFRRPDYVSAYAGGMADPARKELGARLKVAREARGMSQSQVAARFNLDKATVSAWETARGLPDAVRLRDLCRLYGVSADMLLFGDAHESSPKYRAARAAVSDLSDDERVALFAAIQAEPAQDHEVEAKMPATRAKPYTNAEEIINRQRHPIKKAVPSSKRRA